MNATCSHFKIMIKGPGGKKKKASTKSEERGKALSNTHLEEKDYKR